VIPLHYALIGAAIFCIARAIWDLKQRRYGWALAGFASGAALILAPIPSHAVKIELPLSSAR
jgi:hypothetical protein